MVFLAYFRLVVDPREILNKSREGFSEFCFFAVLRNSLLLSRKLHVPSYQQKWLRFGRYLFGFD